MIKRMKGISLHYVYVAAFLVVLVLAAVVIGIIHTGQKSRGLEEERMVTLENRLVSISFDKSAGNIVSIYDKTKQLEYIKNAEQTEPFRLDWHSDLECKYSSFSYEKDSAFKDGAGYRLIWQVNPQVTVKGSIRLPDNSDEISFYAEVVNQSDESVMAVEYPIVGGIGNITPGGEKDYLAHSFATGVLIHNPLKNFDSIGGGLRQMPYPEGFSGATMQYFTYYGENKGGLYFAAYDGNYYAKWLNFYKGENDLLEASFMHGYEDVGPRKGVKTDYPVVVKLLKEGSWYEASDIYKAWARKQEWCQKGILAGRGDEAKAKWLLEDMGLATFGIDAMYDRSEWIKTYQHSTGAKIFHVLGPDWAKKDQTFYRGIPGGFDDWFPARFNQANLDAIRQNGDKFAPFEFDYIIDTSGADSEKSQKSLQMMPFNIRSMDTYNFPLLCPVADFTKELHVKKDEYLAKEYKVDAVYYDISANNVLKTCMDASHGHASGAGREITQAYRDNYIKTKETVNKASGRYVAMGTEMVNEVFLDVTDYYQTRAGAQPAAAFEGSNIRPLIKAGEAELIPMFTYVYHEYGPVRLDGWGKLVEETGDLFYYTAARTFLWGGLYELNYEYSPMEVVNGRENTQEEHYALFEPRGYEFSERKAEYLAAFAKMRTGAGNKYLAYGQMMKPLSFETEKTTANWYHYNCSSQWGEYNDAGSLEVPSVVHSAWKYMDKSAGFFFANILNRESKVAFKIDMSQYGLKGKLFKARLADKDGNKELFEIGQNETRDTEIVIPPKSVVMLEIY